MKVFGAGLDWLKEIARDRELDQYEIAVWPTPAGDALASDKTEVETTSSVVFWRQVDAVYPRRTGVMLYVGGERHEVPDVDRRLVFRRAVTR